MKHVAAFLQRTMVLAVLIFILGPVGAHADGAAQAAGLDQNPAGWRDRWCETGGLPGNAYQGSEYCRVADAPRHSQPATVVAPDGAPALRFDHQGGAAYSNVMYQYRLQDHPEAVAASAFSLQLNFMIHSTGGLSMAGVQAVEFAVDRWRGDGTHNDMELQWSNYPSARTSVAHWSVFAGDGSSNETQWIDSGIDAPLSAGSWHTLALNAHATDTGTVYDGFSLDGAGYRLSQSFPRVAVGGNEVTTHVQLDGAAQPVPYEVLVRDVSLSWASVPFTVSTPPSPLPVAATPVPTALPAAAGGSLTVERAQSWCATDCTAGNFGPLVESNGFVNPRGLKFTNGRCPAMDLPALGSADYWDGTQVHMGVTGPSRLARVCVASLRWFG